MDNKVNAMNQSISSNGKATKTDFQLGIVLSLAIAHMLVDIMANVIPLMLTLMQKTFHLSYTQLGVIVMVNMVCTSLIQPVFGYFSDRKSLIWLMPVGILTTGLGLIVFAYAPSYAILLAGVAICGFGAAAFHPEAGRTVYIAAPGKNRGLAQSLFQVGGNAGQALAPLMVPLFLVYTGVQGAGWFIIIALIAVLLVYRLTPWLKQQLTVAKEKKAKEKIGGEDRIGATVLLTVVTTLRSTIVIGISSFLPLYYVNIKQMDLGLANTYIFIFMIAGALGTFFGGPLADRLGNQRVIFWTMLLSIPFLIYLPYTGDLLAFIIIAILGFILVSTTAISVVYGQRLMPGNVGMVTGLMIGFAYGLAGIGITALGYLADSWGIEKVFPVLMGLLIIGFLLTIFLPKDEQIEEEPA